MTISMTLAHIGGAWRRRRTYVEKKGIETPPPVWTSPRRTERERRWLRRIAGKGDEEDGKKQRGVFIIWFYFLLFNYNL
jgi:hypothetical protein